MQRTWRRRKAAESLGSPRTRSPVFWAVAVGLVFGLAWLALYPVIGSYFRNDDFQWLLMAREWEENPSTLLLGHAGSTFIYNLLFLAAYHVSGWQSAAPYFLGLITIHGLCSVLVLWLIYLLTSDAVASLLGGLLFSVMFCHHEAVGWIAAGLHPLMTLFLLLSVIFWILWQRGAAWAGYLGPLAGVFAVLSKDSGVVLAPCLLLVHWLGVARPRGQALDLRRLGWWLAPAYSVLLLWRVLLPPLREVIPVGGPDYFVGPHIASNLALCVPQTVVPDLSYVNYRARLATHLTPPAVDWLVWGAWGMMVVLSLVSALAVWRGSRLVKLGVLWAYAAFIPFAPFSYVYARAPRYLYPGSVGLALLVAVAWMWLGRRWAKGRARRVVAWAAALVVLMANIVPIRLMADSRLRDSNARRHAIERVLEEVPAPRPGDRLYLVGLPDHLRDVGLAVPLLYGVPVTAYVAEPPVGAQGVYRVDLSDVGAGGNGGRVPE